MALTIVAQPPAISLANSPMIFDLHSADNAQAGHKYQLEVRIWKGTTASKPASATFTLKKQPNSAGKAVFDVSRLVREFLEASKPSAITDASASISNADNDVYYVEGKGSATWDAGSDTAVTGNIVLATLGYSLFKDGTINGTLTGFPRQNKLKIHSTGKLSIPLFMTIADTLVITDSDGDTKTFAPSTNTNSKQQVKLLNVSPSKFSGYSINTTGEFTLTFKLSSSVVHTAFLEIVCEERYDPVQLIFINSMGMWEFMTFFKASTSTLEASRTMYKNNTLSYGDSSTAVSYDSANGQKVGYNTNGSIMHVLNTGFVDESEDVRIRELLLSDQVILYDQSKFIGVEVMSNSQLLQKGVNDKVMNYTISVQETGHVKNSVY